MLFGPRLMKQDSHFGSERGPSALQGLSCHCLFTATLNPIGHHLGLAVATLWSIQVLFHLLTRAASECSASECLPCRSGVQQ